KQLRTRANYRLGFDGERFVGEELSSLIVLGFEIYHDVPFDGFNIDHVIVGPRGVFIVETKTRRKPLQDDGKKQYRVQFDGKVLRWPWGVDVHGVEQAKNNAKTLSAWLSSATGEKVWTTPILTLPGWLVDRKVPSEGFHVLNPKEIYQVCAAQPETLTDQQVQRIIHQLNQKCRFEIT
ncbi:MAG: nuclease-related domain-containing protein, partial [Verrucomicrobiota bacterium]